jgi:aspartate/methionine/tyrosine aminotransferase
MSFGQRAGELVAQGHDVIALSLGEPDFGAPAAVRQAMREAMDGRPLPYTPAMGSPALRRAISDFYRDRHGVDVDPGRILITSGASAALLVVLAATTDDGDEVILADPSYPCNRQLIETFGGTVASVTSTPETRFQLDRASVEEATTDRTTAVMIASPSNPTGTSIPFDELTAICSFARSQNLWRIVDEIYLDLSDHRDGEPPRSVLTVDPDAIVINSFSKYFGMTGWRLGWAVLPEALVGPVERLAVNYFLCASTPAQLAALACFTPESLREAEERRIELGHRRQLALTGLAEIGLDVPATPDGAFYVYFDVTATGLGSWEFCERALEEAFVALTPGRDFGVATADTHVRMSYAASRENLKEGLSRLATFVASL